MNTFNWIASTRRMRLSLGPMDSERESACMIVIYGEGLGRRIDLQTEPVLIGRSDAADLQLPHPSVSRRHCEVWHDGTDYRIRDLGATNRTRLNEHELTDDSALLADGDHITVGESILKFVGYRSIEASYHDELYQLATHDALTELNNRRHFEELLEKELARASRHQRPLALVIIDIDGFKRINDTFGRQGGDQILRGIAGSVRDRAKEEDVVARVGGDEFAMFLPETELAEAHALSEQLRQAVEQSRFVFDGQSCSVTCSIGVAIRMADDQIASLMGRAHQAMRAAKDSGHNRVCDEAPVRVQDAPASPANGPARPGKPASD